MREILTKEYLEQKGFILDEDYTNLHKGDALREDDGVEYLCYIGVDGRIVCEREWNNRYGALGWSIHVDNCNFESIGWICINYVDQFETFLNLFKEDE